jgi:hypothetical protein
MQGGREGGLSEGSILAASDTFTSRTSPQAIFLYIKVTYNKKYLFFLIPCSLRLVGGLGGPRRAGGERERERERQP